MDQIDGDQLGKQMEVEKMRKKMELNCCDILGILLFAFCV